MPRLVGEAAGEAKGIRGEGLQGRSVDVNDAAFFERGVVQVLGTWRVVPDLVIIVLGVLPLAYFLFRTYPHLKSGRIEDGESVWEKLDISL